MVLVRLMSIVLAAKCKEIRLDISDQRSCAGVLLQPTCVGERKRQSTGAMSHKDIGKKVGEWR